MSQNNPAAGVPVEMPCRSGVGRPYLDIYCPSTFCADSDLEAWKGL